MLHGRCGTTIVIAGRGGLVAGSDSARKEMPLWCDVMVEGGWVTSKLRAGELEDWRRACIRTGVMYVAWLFVGNETT